MSQYKKGYLVALTGNLHNGSSLIKIINHFLNNFQMKKLFDFKMAGSVLLMLAISLASCKQDLTVEPQKKVKIDETERYSQKLSTLQGVTLEDGILKFKDLETYKEYGEAILNCKEEDYQNLCSKIGLQSLANIMRDYRKEYEKEDADITQLNEKYKEWIVMENDRPDFKIKGSGLSRILNIEGFYKIGNHLYFFDEKGETLNVYGDKLELIRFINNDNRTNKSDPKKGIFFFDLPSKESLQTRSACGVRYDGPFVYNSSKDRRAYVNIQKEVDFFIDNAYVDYNTGNVIIVSYGMNVIVTGENYASKKGLFGWVGVSTEWGSTWSWSYASQAGTISDGLSMYNSNSQSQGFSKTKIGVYQYLPPGDYTNYATANFTSINISYWNRGGVNINYSCQ